VTDANPVGLMRNLGRFVGHLAAGVRSKPGAPATKEVRRSVEEETRQDGVVLRRTVIEEVEVPTARAEETNEHAP